MALAANVTAGRELPVVGKRSICDKGQQDNVGKILHAKWLAIDMWQKSAEMTSRNSKLTLLIASIYYSAFSYRPWLLPPAA
jgi:hypothetical protein